MTAAGCSNRGHNISATTNGDSGKFDSTVDTILDFSSAEGDVIDLSAIDPISGGAAGFAPPSGLVS